MLSKVSLPCPGPVSCILRQVHELIGRTFGPEILGFLHIIHCLQCLSLLPRKGLFVIIFAGSPNPIEENATGTCVFEEVDEHEDEAYQHGGAKGGEQADKDAVEGIW